MELSVSSETTLFNMKLQLEICPHLRTGSSAEDRGRIYTRGDNPNPQYGKVMKRLRDTDGIPIWTVNENPILDSPMY